MEGARAARADDLDLIDALLRAAAIERRDERGADVASRLHPPLHIDASTLHDDAWCVVVGTYDHVVLGVAAATLVPALDGTTLASLHDLYVEPDARGVGIGDALMRHVMAWAERRGCTGIDASVLPGDRAGKNFFERFGLVARAILVHRALDGAMPPGEVDR